MSNPYSEQPPRREAVEDLEAAALQIFLETQVSDRPLVAFTPVNVEGVVVDALGCHYGIDRTLYYDVYSGGMKLVGMNDWRLEEFLGRADAGILSSLPASVKPLVNSGLEKSRTVSLKQSPKLRKGGLHL